MYCNILYCKRFDAQRNILYRSLLAANVHIDFNTLLFGSQIYNIDTNRHVFITVQTYIKETCRFSFRMKCTSATQFEINPMTNRTDLYNKWTSLQNTPRMKKINNCYKM
jgi:hypothetical protein